MRQAVRWRIITFSKSRQAVCGKFLDSVRQGRATCRNVALLKQVEDLKKRYEGIDPDEVRKPAEQKQRLDEERQLKAGDVELMRIRFFDPTSRIPGRMRHGGTKGAPQPAGPSRHPGSHALRPET